MPRYVAFLRAINVGGRIVKMDELRRAFEKLGFDDVETFIASGNVIFETRAAKPDALERKIEAGLEKTFGYEVGTYLRTLDELAAVEAFRPFSKADLEAEGHRMYVGFTRSAIGKSVVKAIQALTTPNDAFAIKGRELYWLSRVAMSESKVSMAKLEKTLGEGGATFRNVSTVKKLLAKYV